MSSATGERTESIHISADAANLEAVVDFIAASLCSNGFNEKAVREASIATEELFINICTYAYPEKAGSVDISFTMRGGRAAAITFQDSGLPFDPVNAREPDIHIPAAQRKPGGMGIHMARKLVSDMEYRYEDGTNTLTIIKTR